MKAETLRTGRGRWAGVSVRIAVPVLILFWLMRSQDLDVLWNYLRTVDLSIFTLSFLALSLRMFFGGLRSRLLLAHKGEDFPLSPLVRYYFIGNFFNLFMPILFGRDLARGYFLWKTARRRSEALSTIVIERFVGIVALGVFSIAAVTVAFLAGVDAATGEVGRVVVWGGAAILALFLAYMAWRGSGTVERMIPRRFERVAKPAVRFLDQISSYNRAPGVLLMTFWWSIVFQFCGIVSTWLIGVALGADLSFLYFLILLPVVWLLSLLPISLNGLGVREGAFVLLFGAVGMVREQALAISLLWFGQTILLGIIGGFFFMTERSRFGSYRDFADEMRTGEAPGSQAGQERRD